MKCSLCQAEMVSSATGWLCPSCGHTELVAQTKVNAKSEAEVVAESSSTPQAPGVVPVSAAISPIAPPQQTNSAPKPKSNWSLNLNVWVPIFVITVPVILFAATYYLPGGDAIGTTIFAIVSVTTVSLIFYGPLIGVIIVLALILFSKKGLISGKSQQVDQTVHKLNNLYGFLGALIIIMSIGLGLFTNSQSQTPSTGLGGLLLLPFYLIITPGGWAAIGLFLLYLYSITRSRKPGISGSSYLKTAKFFGLLLCSAIGYTIYAIMTTPYTGSGDS